MREREPEKRKQMLRVGLAVLGYLISLLVRGTIMTTFALEVYDPDLTNYFFDTMFYVILEITPLVGTIAALLQVPKEPLATAMTSSERININNVF